MSGREGQSKRDDNLSNAFDLLNMKAEEEEEEKRETSTAHFILGGSKTQTHNRRNCERLLANLT